jgi:hypothetical protein
MKKIILCFVILLSVSCVTIFPHFPSLRRHADSFYDYNDNYAPGARFPLIDPIDVIRTGPSSPWKLGLGNDIWIQIPNSNNAYYAYSFVDELEKFAVKNGVIMAYSSYVDRQVDAYIQNNYYHWFVTIPDKNITKGFQTKDEFDQYIQTLGIQSPDWQTSDEAFDKYFQTGCLEWIPDCNQ